MGTQNKRESDNKQPAETVAVVTTTADYSTSHRKIEKAMYASSPLQNIAVYSQPIAGRIFENAHGSGIENN